MNKYTEAIQGDDVVILCDGIPMGVGEILAALNAATPPADAALADADIPPHYTNSEAAAFECGYQKALRARPQAVAEGLRYAQALVDVMDGTKDYEIQADTGLPDEDCKRIADARRDAKAMLSAADTEVKK